MSIMTALDLGPQRSNARPPHGLTARQRRQIARRNLEHAELVRAELAKLKRDFLKRDQARRAALPESTP